MDNKYRYFWCFTDGRGGNVFDTEGQAIEDAKINNEDGFVFICQVIDEFDYKHAAEEAAESVMDTFDNIYDDFQGGCDDDAVHYARDFRAELTELLEKLMKEKTSFSVVYKGTALYKYNIKTGEKTEFAEAPETE